MGYISSVASILAVFEVNVLILITAAKHLLKRSLTP